ncbi:glycosyltransferase [Pseudomonas sp. H11T01]|uniref:glycosyltransferase n=1 Tax=Pseudomonas sp. H11T01 TaxID=3402749 RepID=UPI003AD440BD
MKTQKHIVVVLGMHRSGTSAITRALKVMGVELGANLLPPMPGVNEKGFWEDADINALNIELLGILGHDWHTLSPIFSEELESSSLGDIKLKAIDLLRKKLTSTQCFGMKDPRMARLLPFWQSVFSHVNASTSYVISCRNPMSVARSLSARDGFALEKGYLLWQEHMLNSLIWTENCPRLVVDYDRFLDDPAKQMSRISQCLNFSFDSKSADFLEFEVGFLEKDLRHTQFLEEDLPLDRLVPASVVELYGVLLALAKDQVSPEDAAVKNSLSALNKQLRDARVLLEYTRKKEDAVVELSVAGREKDGLLAHLNQIVADHNKVLATFNDGIVERDEQVVGLKQVLCDRDERLAYIYKILAANDEETHALKSSVEEFKSKTEELAQTVLEKNISSERLYQTLDARNVQMSALENSLADLRQEAFQKDSELKSMEADALAKRKKLLEIDVELMKVYSSRSWRLTRPLRFLRRVLDVKNGYIKVVGRVRSIGLLARKTKAGYIIKGIKLLGRLELRSLRAKMRAVAHREKKYAARDGVSAYEVKDRIPLQVEIVYPVDIIVPIYNGYEYLEPLFDSILAGTNSPYRVILVNDASPDERVSGLVEEYQAKFPSCLLLSNEENLGFPQTVNKAVAYTSGDFVLLNTDTEVPNGWLERLMAPLLNDRNIASATPFTNSGTICSFPEFCADNPIFMGLPVEEVDREFERVSPIAPLIKIPTGVGFCMAFNGDIVRSIGMFDSVAYGRGYAEENDWCMRASVAGHTHVLVTNLFVYHKHGGSFSSIEKKKLIDKNLATLQLRYPDYNYLVHQHISADPASWVRDIVAFNIMTRSLGAKALLIIDHNIGGGANQYSEKLKDSYLSNRLPVIFFCDDATTGEMFLRLTFGDFDKKIFFGGLQEIKSALLLLDIGEGFYNEAVSHKEPEKSLRLFLDVLKEKKSTLQVAMHDFYPICPSYTLINDRGVYCGVPEDIDVCKKCIANNNADFLHEGVDIIVWRSFWLELFSYCSGIVCFSENTRSILLKAYSDFDDKISVVPHEINVEFSAKPFIDFSKRLHVGVVGGINYQKGLKVVTDIARFIRKNNLDVMITVVGVVDSVTPIEGLNVTGSYEHSELPAIFEKNNINVALFPSVWPETFSYVTAELMQLDIPLACFNLGAPAERVRQYDRGLVLESMDPEDVVDELSKFYSKIKNETSVLTYNC